MPEATIPDVAQIVSDYNDLFSGDLSKLGMVSESYTFSFPFDEIHGRDGLEEFLREQETAFPDASVETDDVLTGDEVVMQEFTWKATHEGEFEGISPTGREIETRGMAKLVLADGKIQEDRTYFDSREFLAQLEVTE
ncbi:hypothetical protein CV102_13385 [Natronococcus pandeyae]|uniref:Ester cyclase n=1 Tax=Natronococcus pandeyae TaxID=2055836 RepID=A0A8J8Q478_9EURY|nr:ester cyclase [Natronococcus pandeyae]TYL38188.1 hypothetical protein CV102_13385 [Natronococcus pandeyae]